MILYYGFLSLQGSHTKTGQLAAIKVMNVTEVSRYTVKLVCTSFMSSGLFYHKKRAGLFPIAECLVCFIIIMFNRNFCI